MDIMGWDRVGWGEITEPRPPHFHTSLKVDHRADHKCKIIIIIIINSRSGAERAGHVPSLATLPP